MARVAINGFGRIGRQSFKALLERYADDLEIVAVNDLTDNETLAHLLRHDSTYGPLEGEVRVTNDQITVDFYSEDDHEEHRVEMAALAEKDPTKLPWRDLGIDIVIESTGRFTDAEKARAHLQAGAKKVIITAPAKGEDITICLGVNESKYDHAIHNIISNASCTTNCLAPVAKVLHDAFGIKRGLMTTVHATTATQKVVDGVSGKDWRFGRGILENIIPASTGAAEAVTKVLPALKGRLTGMSFRVPVSDVSVVDLTCELVRETSYEQICAAMKRAAEGPLHGILAYTEEEVVSTDIRGEACTAVFDAKAGIQLDPTFVKVVAWYDNEWGYASKLLDLAVTMAKA